jgi:hypothetical protein
VAGGEGWRCDAARSSSVRGKNAGGIHTPAKQVMHG